MIRIKRLLSHRLTKTAAAATAALAATVAGTGTANAAIYWNSVQMVVQANQQCLAAQGNGVRNGSGGSIVPGCMAGGTGWVYLESAQPDSNGHANVQIMTYDNSHDALCLTSSYPGTGPNGPWSTQTYWALCGKATSGDPSVWTMETAAPPQNVGNPAGLKHFISFYNRAEGVCLDGGIGVYGFNESDCNFSNNWQVWNIYTNQGSSPYTP